jgi:hypothetical protein
MSVSPPFRVGCPKAKGHSLSNRQRGICRHLSCRLTITQPEKTFGLVPRGEGVASRRLLGDFEMSVGDLAAAAGLSQHLTLTHAIEAYPSWLDAFMCCSRCIRSLQ